MGRDYALTKVGTATIQKYPEKIPLSLEVVLEKLIDKGGVSHNARISLKPFELGAIAEPINGSFHFNSKGVRSSIHPGEWVFLYVGDRIHLGCYGTYKLKENI